MFTDIYSYMYIYDKNVTITLDCRILWKINFIAMYWDQSSENKKYDFNFSKQ